MLEAIILGLAVGLFAEHATRLGRCSISVEDDHGKPAASSASFVASRLITANAIEPPLDPIMAFSFGQTPSALIFAMNSCPSHVRSKG